MQNPLRIERCKEFLQGGERGRFPNRQQLVLGFLIGVLLLVIGLPTGRNGKTVSHRKEETEKSLSATGQESYERELERRLANTLKEMQGVGRVQVMVTFQTGFEKVVEKDRKRNHTATDKGETQAQCNEEEITEETTVYERNQEREEHPYVTKECSPRVEGALIACDGGDKPQVIRQITEALEALFGIQPHKIKVTRLAGYIKRGSVKE